MVGTACDTSVLVPALISWHPDHHHCRDLLADEVTHLPAHVIVEAFGVMTRLPAPHRLAGGDAASALGALDAKAVALPPAQQVRLIGTLSASGVRGGAVYDGLVGATAAHHGLLLLTRDRRARATYDSTGVDYRYV